MAKVYINEKNKKGHINPELYGNFSEHLGRCIYEGLYVGEDSDIPNTNGMRKDCLWITFFIRLIHIIFTVLVLFYFRHFAQAT